MPVSRQASGADLPCTINTSIWRSSVTICSALNLFFGMTQAPFQAHFLTSLGLKKPGQVKVSVYNAHQMIVICLAHKTFIFGSSHSWGLIVERDSIEHPVQDLFLFYEMFGPL